MLVDRDTNPRWKCTHQKEVSGRTDETYFAALSEEKELKLCKKDYA